MSVYLNFNKFQKIENMHFVTTEVMCDYVKSNFENFKDKLGKFGEKYK